MILATYVHGKYCRYALIGVDSKQSKLNRPSVVSLGTHPILVSVPRHSIRAIKYDEQV